MNLGLSPRDLRTLIFGVTTVGSLIALGKGVPAWRRWDEAQRAAAAERKHELHVAQQGVRLLTALRDSAAARTARASGLVHALVTARSAQEAGAFLASSLGDAAEASDIRVFAVSIRPDSAVHNGYARVAVRVTATGDVSGLARYLDRVETDSMLLAVRELNVNQPDPSGPDNKVETLRFELLIEALARIDSTRRDSTRGAP